MRIAVEDRPRVLVVEDEALERNSLVRLLRSFGHLVEQAQDGAAALEIVELHDVAVAIVDLNLPTMHGFELIGRLKIARPTIECVVLTGAAATETATEARAHGASDYFEKPIDDTTRFEQVIRRAFEVHVLRQRIGQLRPSAPSPIIGSSRAMEYLRELVEKMSGTTASVLITGESGVGKEVVAEALHQASRRKGEFVRVNCASVPASLIEAELFGAEAGTFTGQLGRRDGLLAFAENGTLFLDEIGDMPLDLQPKLLRALQNLRYRPLGSRKERVLTARVVAATNVDLQRAVSAGRFREDLYFRLAVLTIHVPPLRERPDDVHVLLHWFLSHVCENEGRAVPPVSEAVAQALSRFRWPGNARQLANAVLRAVILAPPGRELRLEDFGLDLTQRQRGEADSKPWTRLFDLPLQEAKGIAQQEFAREYLREHLRRCDGNISKAAASARMLRPNFKREMRRYSVVPEEED